jgi:hypothetical protein
MKIRPLTYLLVLACDLTENGAALGRDAVSRCKQAILYAKQFGGMPTFVTSAGMANRENFPDQEMPMAYMQRVWLQENFLKYGYHHKPEVLSPSDETRCVWSTRAEIACGLKLIENDTMTFGHGRSIRPHTGPLEIVLVTSWYHAPRTRFVAWDELRKARKRGMFPRANVHFHISVASGTRLSGLFWEPLKWVGDIIRCFKNPEKWSPIQNAPF